jgi:hypothetical protein
VCFSALTVGFWIEKTYHHGVRQWVAVVEYVFAAFYLLDYAVRLARRGFTPGAPWQLSCLLDVFCAVPLLLQATTNRAWLSVTYTRALAVMWAFEALHAAGATARMSELRVRLIQAVLRLGALVFCFSGTMLIVEFLGDIEAFADKYLDSEMGAISFHQMCYFTLVTISTIGYGDFSPATLIGRTLLLFIILGGVAFFSYETSELLSLRAIEASGRGSFRPRRRRGAAAAPEPHLLVCGGAVAAGSATLAEFLAEVLHPGRGEGDVPEVVVLCEGEPAPALYTLLARRWCCNHATMLTGSPMVPKDLARARASDADMAIVLADLTAADAAAEDEETLLAAAALHRLHPGLPLRVLLIRRESKRLALNAGLPRSAVIAAHDLGPRVAALGVRCPGAAALVSNLVRTAPRVRGATAAAIASAVGPTPGGEGPARWLLDYAAGAAHSLHGVLLGPRLDGRGFHAAAAALFARHGVVLIAVQFEGRVVLSPRPGTPEATLHEGDVAFALGLSAEHVAHAVANVTLPMLLDAAPDGEDGSLHGDDAFAAALAADATGSPRRLRRELELRAAAEGAASRAWKAAFHAARHAAHAAAMQRLRLEASKPHAERVFSTVGAASVHVRSASGSGHAGGSLGGLVHNIAAFSGVRERLRTASAAALPPAGASPGPTPRRPSRRAQLRELHASSAPPVARGALGAFSAADDVDALAEEGGHVVVVSLDPQRHAWAQVEGVIEALRQPFLPQAPSLVVLCAAPPPAELQRRFGADGLLFVDAGAGAASGDVAATDWGAVLLQAGVDTAAAVLYLAGEAPPTTRAAITMVDRRAVLFATVLETHCAAWGRDVFAAVELHNPHSVWHLRQVLHAAPVATNKGPARRLALTTLGAADGASTSTLAAEAGHSAHGAPRSHLAAAAEFAAARCGRPTAAARQLARAPFAAAAALAAAALAAATPRSVARGSDPVLHARFAAGRVLLRTDVARLMASVFFTPGAIEIVTALSDPLGEHQAVMLWRVELDASPLLRSGHRGLDGVPTTFGELFVICAAGGATALGLERRREDGGATGGAGLLPFVAACPQPDEPLRDGDALIALAPPEWARAHSPEYAAVRLLDATLRVQAAWRAKRRRSLQHQSSTAPQAAPQEPDAV